MRKTTTRRLPIAAAIPLAILAAQALPAAAETLSEQLQQCSQFGDDTKRLACYDQVAGNLQQHAEKQFGQEQKQVIEEAPDSITATITEATEGAYGKYIFTLDNGQVWRQVGSNRAFWRAGDQVVVERGALGSFLMRKTTGGRTLRVKRLK